MNYHRLLSRLYNTPLAIDSSKLESITNNVTLKLLAGDENAINRSYEAQEEHIVPFQLPENVAVIKVFDSLVAKNGAGSSGVTSYEDISRSIRYSVKEGKNHLVFYHDSPGGEVAGMEGLSRFIASLPEQYNVTTTAITDGQMCSASYMLASACQKIYATSTAMIGSIGVVMTLVDVTKMDEQDGINYTILRSKSDKAAYNPHEELSEKVVSDAQKTLQSIDTIVMNLVNANRPSLSVDKMEELNGKVLLAEEALAAGLIDKVVPSFEAIFEMLDATASSNLVNNNRGKNSMTLEEENAKLQADYTALQNSTDAKVAAERTRCSEIIEAAEVYNISAETMKEAITEGYPSAMVAKMFQGIKAGIDKATGINTTASSNGSATKDLVNSMKAVEDAKQEANDTGKKVFMGGMFGVSDLIKSLEVK